MVRHLESSKNVDDRFARENDRDHLTDAGMIASHKLAGDIYAFLSSNLKVSSVRVWCSSAPRAIESAERLCEQLDVEPIVDADFNSILVPQTMGLTHEELRKRHAKAAWELNLYRAGIFDSYRMQFVRDVLRAYEGRIDVKLCELANADCDAGILFGHRSMLTAATLQIARACRLYPDDYFGFLPIDLGSVTLVRYLKCRADSIAFANLPTSDLATLGVDYLQSLNR